MDKIKEQPSNIEAEKALLGSVLLGGTEVYEKAKSWIKTSDSFYNDMHKSLWKSIQSLYRDKQEIDIVTIVDRFKRLNPNHEDGVTYYITGLPEYVPTKHLGGYAYIFLRGIPTAKEISNQFKDKPTPGLIVESAPIQRIVSLDN